ncbi:Mg-protoporphyrin IX monomethyl ester oxidative cyclase [Fictibacillus macauensis ZFHKF-1]|uniref:Mg-protoporphyrin IX monomethyl ester oxidative cyclase n=1 Tax=Fictibacillus macauensis ZFHKF-1 TaxID=1196324 RepID=I8AGM6_9BACL|nr:B12-binding domain-containing radical SAM protein [Fictibacillus macauensis]EIT84544.1 Mg-protoporphyrin IX monomethyl ester oxidative cyclase [Fictibacillus macauensis ZFHKF-1]
MNIVVSTLNAKYIHTCLALRYLKAYSEPDYSVQMAEYTIKDPSINIVSDLYTRKPDVLGFSCYIWNIEETIKVIEMYKKISPHTKIVLGGPEVSYDVTHWLDRIPDADFIVVNEGEISFKHLLNEIEGEGRFEKVAGLAWRKNGKPRVNPPREKLDLKTVSSPYRFEEDLAELGKRVTYFETSRGCPYSCAFCLSSIEVGVRYFDIQKVKDDLLFLMDHGAKTIKFVDRTFNIKRDYALEMFQFLIENRRPGVVFQFEITADIMRPEVIDYLNEHAPKGLFRFEIGVQSTNDHVNELVQRRQNFEKLTRTVTTVKNGGKIAQHLDLIAGLPEEDYASFRKTFNDVFAFGVEEVQLGFLKMLRGTGLRLTANQHDYIYMNHSPYEILGNNVLSFDDIVKIKRVEDVLEKYWNDHRMDTTLQYLLYEVFPSPFDFFQEFGDYWEAQGWSRIGHQLEDLFARLKEFLLQRDTKDMAIIESLMKYDYFSRKKHRPHRSWWEESLSKDENDVLHKWLKDHADVVSTDFSAHKLLEKDLVKHTVLDVIPFNLHHYLKTGSFVHEPVLSIVYYNPKTKIPEHYAVSSSQLPAMTV